MTEVDFGALPLVLLLTLGLLSGAGSVWIVKRSADPSRLRANANQIAAHLLEFRLFADEPALILRAQWDLLVANGRFLRLLAIPSLLLLAPYWFLLAALEGTFSHAALKAGAATVLTVQCRHSGDVMAADFQLEAPPGFAVDSPPVRIPAEAQVCWRVRATTPTSGQLRIHCNGRVLTKSFSAEAGLQNASDVRPGTLGEFLFHPFETPFRDSTIQSIRVEYPPATVFDFHWLFWFSIASVVGAAIAVTFA